jgi:hypothetical protein
MKQIIDILKCLFGTGLAFASLPTLGQQSLDSFRTLNAGRKKTFAYASSKLLGMPASSLREGDFWTLGDFARRGGGQACSFMKLHQYPQLRDAGTRQRQQCHSFSMSNKPDSALYFINFKLSAFGCVRSCSLAHGSLN